MWKRALKPLNGGMRSHPRGLISHLPIKCIYLISCLSFVFRWCTIYSEQIQAGCYYLLFSSLFSSHTHRVSVNNLIMLFTKQLNMNLFWWSVVDGFSCQHISYEVWGQGNIFTPVCHSVHSGEYLGRYPHGTRYTPQIRYTPRTRYTPRPGIPLGPQTSTPPEPGTPPGPGTPWD